MKSMVFPVAIAILTSGCGSNPAQQIERNAGATLRGQTVGYTVRAAPRFNSLSKAHALANTVIGAAGSAMAATGLSKDVRPQTDDAGDVAAKHGLIADPAVTITAQLLAQLESRHAITPVVGGLLVADGVKPADIAYASRGRARYVLDVETVEWGLSTFSMDWFHYQLHYQARARLIDVESGKVVAAGACKDKPDDKEGAPNFDQLMINNAALLKEKLAQATSDCVAELGNSMLRW